MKIKGKLIIIGGAEDKGESQDAAGSIDCNVENYFEHGILKRILEEGHKKTKSRIEVLTTASTVAETGNDYKKAFKKLKALDVGILNIASREEAMQKKYTDRLKAADILMVTGGNQERLTSILGGTIFMDMVHEKYQKEDFIYAGSSAGAAVVSSTMIGHGESANAFYKGELTLGSGFGLMDNIIFDTHFVKRGRFGRLLQAIVANPRLMGVGIEENTAILVRHGDKMEAIGPGMTILVDGSTIVDTNYNDIDDEQPISIENVRVHVMSKYDTFDLTTNKLTIDHRNHGDDV